MDFQIAQSKRGDSLWPHVIEHSPQTVRWVEDPKDDGNYNCFLALGDKNKFMGLCVIDIAPLAFGPLSDRIIGFLEELRVLAPYRRNGIGTALLHAALSLAWQRGANNVHWVLDYENTEGIAFCLSAGVAFIAEKDEDPETGEPEEYYFVVAVNPETSASGRLKKGSPE